MTTIDLLHALLRVNLAAGAAVVGVSALRKPARRLAGARQAYSLWLLPPLAVVAGLLPARQITITLPPLAPMADKTGLIAGGPLATSPQVLDLPTFLLWLWLAGAALAVAVVLILQLRFASAAAKGVIGPAVVGVFRPRIIMPPSLDEMFDPKERSLVMAHEEAHIARHDSRTNGLSVLFQCLFWFNPLVHLAAHLARIDQEMACDEVVITRFPGARQTYARALVKAQLATRPLPLGCCWPSGTEHPLEERIAMLKIKTKSRAHRLAAGATLAALCAATGAAAWAAQPPSVAVVHAAAIATPTPAPVQQVASQQAEAPKPALAAKPAPAPTAEAPTQVCITNACMPHTDDGKVRTVANSIAKGDAQAVIALGGSGKDVVAALLNGPSSGPAVAGALQHFAALDIVGIGDRNGNAVLIGPSGEIFLSPQLGVAPVGTPDFTAIVAQMKTAAPTPQP